MDALSDVLRTLRLTGGVFLDARFSAPWSLVTNVQPEKFKLFLGSSNQIMAFHYVISGKLVAHVVGEQPRELTAGALILLPRNDLHVLASEPGLKRKPASDIVMKDSGLGLWELRHGGGGEEVHIVCGFFGCDSTFDPLIAALPPMFSINVAETKGGAWIEESFTFATQSLASGGVGAAAIVSKLSELMFVEALRRYIEEMPEQSGWLAGLRDPAIGRALALMHAQPQKPWSADELAEAVNLSRSTFADRFSALIGYPPIKYLIAWRMQLAARMLRETSKSVAQVAFDVGYDSEAAFRRAFRRELGRPPSAWRNALPVE